MYYLPKKVNSGEDYVNQNNIISNNLLCSYLHLIYTFFHDCVWVFYGRIKICPV